MPFSELSEQQQALIANRTRVWEVRRFCQVLPSVIKYSRGVDNGLTSQPLERNDCLQNAPDGALAALLRCLVHRIGVDLAMISLLDDHTQYFVSGASRTNMNEAKVTLDSTKWYGCESVSHHGGLCERTITMQNRPGNMALYEELDMAKLDRTKDLPFVKGEIAKFRHYAGVPLNPYGGPNIGTVFVFCEAPSDEGLSVEDRTYLFETASHIIKHFEQAVEALEGKRVLRFNKNFASLLDAEFSTKATPDVESEQPGQSETMVSNLYTEATLHLYQLAATLLQDTFEFDGVRIHEVDQFGSYTNNNPDWNGSKVLAQHLGPMEQQLGDPSQTFLERVLEMFPQGCVIQTLGGSDGIVAATNADQVVLIVDELISSELPQIFPAAKQIIVMPLWDTHRERNIGAVLGFANNQSRVYLGSTDLLSISAFCTTLMTQVRRLEVQAMDKIKSDFLGSMSHEMRTPLHGILSSLELLADTTYNADQHDLLETARYSSVSLLNTIEHVLHFSKISSTTQVLEETRSNGSSAWTGQQSSPRYPQAASISVKKHTSKILGICEEAFQREVRNLRLRDTMQHQFPSHSQRTGSRSSSPPSSAPSPGPKHHPAIFFDTNVSLPCTLTAVASFRTVFTHLLNNALKFSYPTGCVRVTLDVDENFCTLRFIDAGKGINPDFLRHSIFEAFSQEDPLVEGTGLGLSIVKRTIAALSGRLHVESKESRGSTFTATFPSKRVVFDPSHTTELGASGLPELQIRVFSPSRWVREGGVRGDRCNEMLLASLTRSLGRWFRVTIVPWESSNAGLRLLIVLEEDLAGAKQISGDVFGHNKCLVLCPDLQTTLNSETTPQENIATIVGPVTLSSLQEALTCLFPDLDVPPYPHDDHEHLQTLMEESTDTILAAGRGEEETNGITSGDVLSRLASQLTVETTIEDNDIMETISTKAISLEATSEADGKGSSDGVAANTAAKLPVNNVYSDAESARVPSQKHNTREPKLLLVDDNPVNLKVLSMYAQKCSKIKAKSVDGGQKAIDAFKQAFFEEDKTSQRFDLIFLDLSMPEVSGFDVARQIREIETQRGCQSRVYICALTGLSSDKDRNAAYASGVDQYIVKPARLGDLQWVVGRWRDSLTCE